MNTPDERIVSGGYSYILESKFVSMVKSKNRYKSEVHTQKKEIADLKRKIRELETELRAVKQDKSKRENK